MPTTYEKCDVEVSDRVTRIIKKHHPDLKEAAVNVGCVFASNPEDAPVKLNGYPCAAKVKKIGLKERVQGMPDAEIVIDAGEWQELGEKQKDALIDHELQHLQVQRDKLGGIKTDDANRPKLKLRLHDWQLGGFQIVAERYGDEALEVQAAQKFREKFGQLLMWAEDAATVG